MDGFVNAKENLQNKETRVIYHIECKHGIKTESLYNIIIRSTEFELKGRFYLTFSSKLKILCE